MSRRSQSQKKRHTKPCKFFQFNRCPHPAEVCDFAHVIVNPPIPFFGGNGTASCRYYPAGPCVNTTLCTFQRGTEGTFDAAVDSALESSGVHNLDATYLETPPLYANYPSFSQSWSHNPISPPFSPIADSVLFSSARCRDSIDTSISSSSVESDESVVVTDDPQYQEHSHSPQSQVFIADDSPVIHVPPYHHPLSYINSSGILSPTHGYDYYRMDGSSMGGLKVSGPHRSRSGPKPISKAKLIKYKTKPCKFFPTERGCPNGNACTFIHGEAHPRTSSPPPKPHSDSETRKNFVPIPWRVIGGGVRVGIQTDDAENNETLPSFSKDLSLDISSIPNEKISLIKPGNISRQRSNSIPSTASITQFRVDHLFSAESPGVL